MVRIIDTADLDESTVLNQNETLWVYNGLDCCVTYEIREKLAEQLAACPVRNATYATSRSMRGPIMEMTARGILIDKHSAAVEAHKMKEDVKKLEHNLSYILSGAFGIESFNAASPKQVAHLLYDVLRLPVQKKRSAATGTYAPTTDREALEKLLAYYDARPILNILLAIRDLEKAVNLLEKRLDKDQRFRANFNIAGTKTGRLSSSISEFGTGSNLQNIDRRLRRHFVASRGRKFCNVDLEQADSRNLGAICWNLFRKTHGEAFAGAYLDACESGDLHTTVTRMVWPNDLPWTEDRKANKALADTPGFYREKSRRDLSKTLGHGSNYRGKPPQMAKHSHIAENLVVNFQSTYFNSFPCIPLYHDWVANQLATVGYIDTLLGRRRHFFGSPVDDRVLNAAVAYSPQSMTGDEINFALLQLFLSRFATSNHLWLLCQVHDSILFEYPEEMEEEILGEVMSLMRCTITLDGGREFTVPLEAKVGWNWGDRNEKNPDGLIKWTGSDNRSRRRPAPHPKFLV